MAPIACVTSVTPDLVTVVERGPQIIVEVDGVGLWLDGATRADQLANLWTITSKLIRAHDAIAAQAGLFDAEVDPDCCPTCGSPDPMIFGNRCLDLAQLVGGRSLVDAFHPEGAQA